MMTRTEAELVLNVIRQRLDEGGSFSSHDFIQQYCADYETEYLDWLIEYHGTNRAFQNVHGLIGRYLSEHCSELHIVKVERGDSECIHGTIDRPMWWRFV